MEGEIIPTFKHDDNRYQKGYRCEHILRTYSRGSLKEKESEADSHSLFWNLEKYYLWQGMHGCVKTGILVEYTCLFVM